jgi:hypothetical protein
VGLRETHRDRSRRQGKEVAGFLPAEA